MLCLIKKTKRNMKKIVKQTVLLIVLTLSQNISFGQISQGGTPYSFQSKLKKSSTSALSIDLQKSIPVKTMPEISTQTISSIKQQNKLQEESEFIIQQVMLKKSQLLI